MIRISIFLLLCLQAISLQSQVSSKKEIILSCSEKLNKWAQWQTANTIIQIVDNYVSIQEVPGIVLVVEIDSKQQIGSLWHYLYEDSVRVTHSVDVSDGFLITILNDHYKCKVKL